MLISLDETIQTDMKIYHQIDQEDWAPPLHSHNHYEIMFLLDGEADFQIEDKHYRIGASNLVFINRLEKHDICVRRYPYDRYCLSLKQDYCMKIIKESRLLSILFQRPASFIHVIPVEKELQEKIIPIFNTLIDETNANLLYAETSIAAWINLFFVTLYRYKKDYFPLQPSDTNHIIIETQRFIHLNYMQPITLDELAKKYCLSKFYLCRNFKETTGYTIKDYIVRQRLAQAKSLLANTNLPITEVAERSGYTNMKQFYRIFRAREEISPARYRQAQKQMRDGRKA